MSLEYLGKNDVIRLTEGKKGGEFVQLKFNWNKMEFFYIYSSETTIFPSNNNGLLLRDISSFTETSLSLRLMLIRMEHIMLHPSYRETWHPRRPSGQSVGSGEKAQQTFSGKGGRAPGYRPLRNHFPRGSWSDLSKCSSLGPLGIKLSPMITK